jgi:hypothetical protein
MVMKETLEEALERLYPENIIKLGNNTSYNAALIKRKDFTDGVNWQAEKMYSEEDMIEFAFNTYHYISELMGVPFNLMSENKLHAMYNFERFKKK